MRKEEIWMVFLAGLLIFSVITVIGAEARTQQACLSHGYPDYRLDYTFTQYCVKRVDQTDVVILLHEIKK
jgi:hypothetical protein